jgi:aspartate aminotransferase-like enzyme
MADPRVLRAMATPLLGQFDPEFTASMDEMMALSRMLFQTTAARTYPVSGTGRAGLEAAMVSLVEPGDRVVIGECGRFGLLLEDLARRCDAEVCVVRAEWGQAVDPVAIENALRGAPTKVLAVVHGETSTGVLQPLAELGRLARAYGALLIADVVVTVGGTEVALDAWNVDVAVGGTQKCLSCPSGLAPIAYNARAEAALRAGLAALGLSFFGNEPPERRLPMLTPMIVPEGVDDARVRRALLVDFGIEIGAAFGALQGKVWRIGTMGYSARRQNVLLLLGALQQVLRGEGWASQAGAGVDAALAHYRAAGAEGKEAD